MFYREKVFRENNRRWVTLRSTHPTFLSILFLVKSVICMICAGILVWGIYGCTSAIKQKPMQVEGKLCGVTQGTFRHRWWNYYERALSFADCELWNEAEKDLRKAIKQRKEDQRRARTFGMHFIDYFPHRELGVVMFHQGRIEEAIQAFEISLSSWRSSKAELYLDRARKIWIEKKQSDQSHPEIKLISPQDGFLTYALSIQVQGMVKDDSFVQSITINGQDIPIDLSQAEISFEKEVLLVPGENDILVSARDLTDKVAQAHMKIYVDRTGPSLQIEEPVYISPYGEIAVIGYAFDDSGIAEVHVGKQKISGDGAKEVQIHQRIPTEPDQSEIKVSVKDQAGNITSASLGLSVESLEQRDKIEKNAPVIQIRDREQLQATYLDQTFIEGSIQDDLLVKEFFINEKQVMKRPGKHVYFSHLLKLIPGENLFTLRGVDSSGNINTETIRIKRDMLSVRETGSRLRIAVNNFEKQIVNEDRQLSFGIEDLLTIAMIKHARFSVVERDNLKKVLEELKISQTGLVDEETALEAGKILAADGMLLGSVLERVNSLEIYARLVDTETAEVIAGVDLYAEDINIEVLRTLSQGLDLKLTRELPVVEGIVVQTQGRDRIIIDIGKHKKIKKGMKIIVYQIGEHIRHPVTDEIIGIDVKEVGQARIQSVMAEMSFAKLNEKTDRRAIKPMLRVITR